MSLLGKLFGRNNKALEKSNARQKPKSGPILDILNRCAETFNFPMMDNGYFYLAASRMSLYRANQDWAIVIEAFGFSPREGTPSLTIQTFGSRLRNRRENFVSEDARQNYLKNNPNNEFHSFYPIINNAWQDDEDLEVAIQGNEIVLRQKSLEVPDLEALRSAGIHPEEDHPLTFELCRYLAGQHRELVLATEDERRHNVPLDLKELIILDDWVHIDLADSELPGHSKTFQQIEAVLLSGDLSHYEMTSTGNTDWRNWPDGGTL